MVPGRLHPAAPVTAAALLLSSRTRGSKERVELRERRKGQQGQKWIKEEW